MQIFKWVKKRPTLLLGLVLLLGILSIASTVPKKVSKQVQNSAVNVVVIDAGHGGKDPGNLGTGRYELTEKAVALNVSLKVGHYIEEEFPDVEVLYTRDTDVFIPLHERTAFANSHNADLFISIHCDAFTSSSAHGSGSYVMGPAKTEANLRMAQRENKAILLEDNHEENYGGFDPNSPEGLIVLSLRQNAHIHQSLSFAKAVQDQMRERVGRVDRGVRQAPFWVISFTTMPSVLIEMGFLTNPDEEDFLMSEKGQDYVASAIYRAFKEYKKNMDSVESTTKSTESVLIDNIPKPKNSEEISNKTVIFKVQLLSSSNRVAITPENFNGLKNVSEHNEDGIYKYRYGAATTYKGAKNLQKTVRKKGYRGAFVVAFDGNNNRIALSKAIDLTKNN